VAPHQSKPRPRPDARPETDAKRPAAEGARADGKRSVAERLRVDAKRSRRTSRPERRQRAPFVLLVVGLMSGGLVSLLLLNTMLAQDAITDANLREEIAVARQENDKLDQKYQLKTQPDVIAQLAENQGLGTNWDDVNSWSSANDQASQVVRER
jgi:hypothetical protein